MLNAWQLTSPVAFGNMAMKCEGAEHVLQNVLMAHPGQSGILQGSHNVDCDILATTDLGIGSRWQHKKQSQAPLEAMGT